MGTSKIGLKKIPRISIMEDKKSVSSNSVECRKAAQRFAWEYNTTEKLERINKAEIIKIYQQGVRYDFS